MTNKKLQLWALGIAGYNCKVEYMAGTANSCADLLSRIPTKSDENNHVQETDDDVDFDDKAYEVGTLNSTLFDSKRYASCHLDEDNDLVKPDIDLPGEFSMEDEQAEDETIASLKKRLQSGTATKTEDNKHMSIDNLVYYLSNADNEPTLRIYVPKRLKSLVIKQYHDLLGHMSTDKCYDTMRLKYYFPNMYKELHTYVDQCVTCQTKSYKTSKPPLLETDIPPYAFATVGLDLSGPYPKTLSGNKYIVTFICLYSGFPEAFAVPDKSAENIVHLLIENIFPRYGSALQLLTDNGTEFVNESVRETLEALNIHHVITSYNSLHGNDKVVRLHKTMHDIISKKIKEDVTSWDLYLNQMLAAIRFHVNDSTKYSPLFFLYNRDPVMPIDTILKLRRKYNGDQYHKIAIQQQHKTFTSVYNNLKSAKKRQNRYANKNTVEINFKICDPVYLKNHRKTSKLDNKWTPYYRIIEQTSPVSYKLKNQLTNKTTKAHARHIRPANLEWDIPKENLGKPLRKSVYVVPPNDSDDDESSDVETSKAKMTKWARYEREDWSSEDDIPLMELKKGLEVRKCAQSQTM